MHDSLIETGKNGLPKRSFDSISRKWALLIGLVACPLLFVFGDEVRGAAAAYSALVIGVAIRYFWDLKNRIWFWAVMAIIVVLHIPIVLFAHWPFDQHFNYVQMLPLALLDFAVMWGIIRVAERMFD